MLQTISNAQQYYAAVSKGFEPLIDARFTMGIGLRVYLQDKLFGKKCPANDQRFFRWVWKHKTGICEETGQTLHAYSAFYCSHILSKGAHPEMRYDPRNINILSYEAHQKWEFGGQQARESMRIWKKNSETIILLRDEYGQYNRGNY